MTVSKKDGRITIHEAATFGTKNGIPWSEVKTIFDAADADKDGKITIREWEAALPVSEAVLEDFRAGFRDLDLDGDKLISNAEWMAYCNGWMVPHPSKMACEEMFDVADTKEPKGQLDYAEFRIGGEKCKTVDDGSCSLLAVSTSNVKRGFLSLLRKNDALMKNGIAASSVPLHAAQFLGAFQHRYKRHTR